MYEGTLNISPRLEFARPVDRSFAWRQSKRAAAEDPGPQAAGQTTAEAPSAGTARAAVGVVALAFFSFLMVVQPALVTTSVTWLAAVFAAVGTLLKGMDSLRQQR